VTSSGNPSLRALLERLARPVSGSRRTYVLGSQGARDLFGFRDPLLAAMKRNLGADESLLVATQDKLRVAGAVLAALAGGNELILPHAASPGILEEIRDGHGVRFALTDEPGSLPSGLTELPMGAAVERARGAVSVRDKGERIVRLFTGGSTGRPRMWDKTVENLLGEAAFLAEHFQIRPRDVILAAVTPQHIYGLLFSILLPAVSGASVVQEIPRFQGEIEKALQEYRVTVFAGAPAHYRALKGRALPGHCLRLAVSSGGMLPEEDSLWFSSRTGVCVTEVYGSTETGGVALRGRADGENHWTPFECVRWKILGDRLAVKSPFLSPRIERDEDGFFLTADRACGERSGRFELLGRTDGIVKVAGKRVSLDEVEARIRALDSVRDAYVLALSSGTMRESEVVCLVVPQGEVSREEDVREALRSVLEPSALPRRMRWVREIPLTAAGKRDREEAEKLFAGPGPGE
jgi:acyl-coenzyme A synthetase/AMP-(fatty) acid ligase